jgi:hypothetical protein
VPPSVLTSVASQPMRWLSMRCAPARSAVAASAARSRSLRSACHACQAAWPPASSSTAYIAMRT